MFLISNVCLFSQLGALLERGKKQNKTKTNIANRFAAEKELATIEIKWSFIAKVHSTFWFFAWVPLAKPFWKGKKKKKLYSIYWTACSSVWARILFEVIQTHHWCSVKTQTLFYSGLPHFSLPLWFPFPSYFWSSKASVCCTGQPKALSKFLTPPPPANPKES